MPELHTDDMSMHPTYIGSPRGGIPHGYTNGHVGSGYANGYAGGGGMAPPHTARSAGTVVQGFMFRSRQERIDWKKIASIDVERITREFDVNSLQESMMGITFCDIEREIDTRMVDSNFVTVFKLAQLIIQYLLHSQEVMAHNTSVSEERVMRLHADHEATKQELARLGEELKKVKQESHKRKKQLKNQQTLIQATANNYHKCMYCEKAFMNMAYLQSHMQRKHPEFTPRPPQAEAEDKAAQKRMREVNERLEKEMEDLKERLKFSESQLVEQRNRTEEQVRMSLQQQQNSQVDVEKQEEMHRRELERWKTEQLEMQKNEMEKMQNMFMREMKEMHDNYTSSQSALVNIQEKLGKQSMLGKVVDEDELDEYRKRAEKQTKEIHKLKEQIQTEVATIENKMADDLKRQEEKWKEKQKSARQHHREEVKELKGLLEHTKQLLTIERQGGDQKGAKYERQMQELLKKNKQIEKQVKAKEAKIKELEQKASKHYEVVEPRMSPPPQMMISEDKDLSRPRSEDEEDEDTDLDVNDDELDTANGYEEIEQQTYMKNKDLIVKGLKEELNMVLQKKMEKRGVPEGMKGITTQSLDIKTKTLKQERQLLAKKHSQFYDIRERFKREIDRKAAELRRSGKPAGKDKCSVSPLTKGARYDIPPPPSYKSLTNQANSKAKAQHYQQPKPQPTKQQQQQQYQQPKQQPVKQQQQSKQVKQQQQQSKQLKQQQQQKSIQNQKQPQKQSLQPALKKLSPGQVKSAPPHVAPRSPQMNGRGRGIASTSKTAPRVSFEDDSEDDDDDEDDESESFDDDEEDENPYMTPAVPPRPASHSRPASHPQPTTNGHYHHQNNNGVTEGQDEDDEDSEWDSEEISELDEAPDRPAPSNKPPTVRPPSGPLVSSLTKSIEMQLSGRRQGQKPVGGVDLGVGGGAKPPQPAPRTPSPSPSPRIPTIPDAGADDDDDADDDSASFSISSLQESVSGTPALGKTTSPTPAPRGGTGKAGNTTDLSSNTYNTSMWGSSKAKEHSTGKSSIVSVTDFDDDDDDFDIHEL